MLSEYYSVFIKFYPTNQGLAAAVALAWVTTDVCRCILTYNTHLRIDDNCRNVDDD